jgi:predicted nucleotidyltransferase
MLAPIITNNITQIKAICKEHKVKELYVFGSASRNEMKEDSDVDFLYTMQDVVPEMDYVDNFFDMLWALEALLGKKVDMVPGKNLKNRIFIEEVNNTKQIIYKE